jgi:riboflavin kinase/FMN adenylyltransferase
VQLLEQLKEKYGYSLTIVPKLTDGEEIISSTLIRGLMERGELSRANELLGAPYFVMGKVLHGNALGRTMGMPTANLIPAEDKKLLPYGVYATTVRIGKKYYKGVTNIGKKPTIGEYAAGVETYIEDFREDIYGETIQVFFHQFIRKEQRFEDVGQLRRQIERDRETAFRERSNIDIPNAISYNDILD